MIMSVIGLCWGDEGKGRTVNYLCSRHRDSLVVRFNGGHQAGHTVYHNGHQHIFSNFGSGTLQGCPTYWSKFCTIDPVGIYKEYHDLLMKSYSSFFPILFIDAKCPVTTPYDKIANQNDHRNRHHGTVGVGFGSTIQREEDYYSLLYEDLFYPSIFKEKLKLINNYYGYFDGVNLNEFYMCVDFIIKNCKKMYSIPEYNNYVLEGAQGLLLDQHYGFFPHVTRSNTGSKNIKELFPNQEIEFYLVTRAYQTRHGNGFMTNEKISDIPNDPNETNEYNPYQGEFRKSYLDLDLLQYAIAKDDMIRESKNKKLVMTGLNLMKDNYCYAYKGYIHKCMTKEVFISNIKEILEV